MRDFEIAELLGVMVPTVKSNIQAIIKSKVVMGDTTNGVTLVGNNLLPGLLRLGYGYGSCFSDSFMAGRNFPAVDIKESD